VKKSLIKGKYSEVNFFEKKRKGKRRAKFLKLELSI